MVITWATPEIFSSRGRTTQSASVRRASCALRLRREADGGVAAGNSRLARSGRRRDPRYSRRSLDRHRLPRGRIAAVGRLPGAEPSPDRRSAARARRRTACPARRPSSPPFGPGWRRSPAIMNWPMIELTGVICGRTSGGRSPATVGEPLLHDLPGGADVGAPPELDTDDRQPAARLASARPARRWRRAWPIRSGR